MFDAYLAKAFFLVVVFSGIPLLVSSACGLLVSVLQAATQVQEQSITFLVKFVSVSTVLCLGYFWGSHFLIAMLRGYLVSISSLGNM